jgi:lysophosphatidate acyltransferase
MPKFTTVVKKEAFYFPPFGITGITHGLIPIDRKNQKSAAATLERCKRVLHDVKAKILMFPEGTRNGGTNMLPFKTGAFRLAIEAQVPIIPVVISPYAFINFQQNTARPGRVTIQVLEPISTVGLTLADSNDLMERTRNKILAEYEILKDKLAQNVTNNLK